MVVMLGSTLRHGVTYSTVDPSDCGVPGPVLSLSLSGSSVSAPPIVVADEPGGMSLVTIVAVLSS